MKVGSHIAPLVLGLEPAADLQTLDQTSPALQCIRAPFNLLLFGPIVFHLPVRLLEQQQHE
jgi:hypothetical protein